MTATGAICRHLMGIVDASVELYLEKAIAPFLRLHEQFYAALNKVLRDQIDQKGPLPKWFTANFITYTRTAVVVPAVLLLAAGHRILPSFLVLLVDFGDFLDGVVARYWAEVQQKKADSAKGTLDGSASDSSDDGFHVVSTGTSQSIVSWTVAQRCKNYGGFIDAILDKAFLIPVWIFLMATVPGTRVAWLQYTALWTLVLTEVASGSVRFKAYYTAGGISPPIVRNLDFSSSAVKADHVGKAKQTFEMVGTSFFILPLLRIPGLALLLAAIPLAYESVRRKIKKRTIYVDGTIDSLDHKVLKFWIQAKALGSKLIVGVTGEGKSDMILNACASSAVDQVIVEAPSKVDLRFLHKYDVDYVVCPAGKHGIVLEDVLETNKCIAIGEDGVAFPVTAKGSYKD